MIIVITSIEIIEKTQIPWRGEGKTTQATVATPRTGYGQHGAAGRRTPTWIPTPAHDLYPGTHHNTRPVSPERATSVTRDIMQAGKCTALLMSPAYPAAWITQLPMLLRRLPRTRASTDQLTQRHQLAEPLPYTEYDTGDLLGHGATRKNEDEARQDKEEMISKRNKMISGQEEMMSNLGWIIQERPGRPHCQATTCTTITARRRMGNPRQGGERDRHIDSAAPGPGGDAKADGAKANCGALAEQPGMMNAMKQVPDKIRCLRMARNNVKNETLEIVHRLLGHEEDTLQHKLGKIVRYERQDDDRYKARAVPRPPIPITEPNIGSHADEIDQPIQGVTRHKEGWRSTPRYARVGCAVLGQQGRREKNVSMALHDTKNAFPGSSQQTFHHPIDAMHQTGHTLHMIRPGTKNRASQGDGMHMRWATTDNWTCPACLLRMCGTETDIRICGPGMFIFGDVYSYSTGIVHTHTPSLHTNDSI